MELLVVLAISSVLFLVLGAFLIANIKLFNANEIQNEVQNQGQTAMDIIIDQLAPTKGISGWGEKNPEFEGTNLKSVSLANLNGSTIIIEYNSTSQKVTSTSGSVIKVLANNISAFKIEPLSRAMPGISPSPSTNPLANTFENCIGLRVNLTVTIKGTSLDMKNDIYFRN